MPSYFYLIVGGLVLYCVKQKNDNYRLNKIIKTFQTHMDMLSKLKDMESDSAMSDKDFKDILPLCEMVDKQVDEIMNMPECKNFPAIYEFTKLAEIVRQEIED